MNSIQVFQLQLRQREVKVF